MLIEVRISDDVLEPRLWTSRVLEVEDGVVTRLVAEYQGVYSPDGLPDVGWTEAQIKEWWSYDPPTPRHPAEFHDIREKQAGLTLVVNGQTALEPAWGPWY